MSNLWHIKLYKPDVVIESLNSLVMKKLYPILALFGLLAFSGCYKDHTYYPDPNYPGPQLREYQFVEDFNNNRNRWEFSDPMNYAWGEISNGTFKFDYLDDYYPAYYARVNPDMNVNGEFIIESKLGSNNTMGIVFGQNYNNAVYGYSFMVDYDGRYSLYDEGGNGFGDDIQSLISPTYSNAVNLDGDWNIVTIHQRRGVWVGYVNDIEVFRIDAQPLYGKEFGFVVVPFTEGEADYIDAVWYR